jgi:FdhD protein
MGVARPVPPTDVPHTDVPQTEWPSSASLAARAFWFDGRDATGTARDVPVEMPVNVVYDDKPFAVMMTTPQDLEDFAYGFSFTEGVVEQASDIHRVEVHTAERGIELRVSFAPWASPRLGDRARNTAGRTGCGLCGIDQLDALPMAAVRRKKNAGVQVASVHRALAALEHGQALNQRTHAVHAAAWCTSDGKIVAIREDVGRHNALDKLIGALMRAGHKPGDGFLVITSRCSFEMVEKAAVYGASTIVAISAPTSLAVERAALHGMTLIAVARRDGALAFNGAEFVHAGAVAGAITP